MKRPKRQGTRTGLGLIDWNKMNADACALLDAAGFIDSGEAPRTWPAPVRLVLGTKG